MSGVSERPQPQRLQREVIRASRLGWCYAGVLVSVAVWFFVLSLVETRLTIAGYVLFAVLILSALVLAGLGCRLGTLVVDDAGLHRYTALGARFTAWSEIRSFSLEEGPRRSNPKPGYRVVVMQCVDGRVRRLSELGARTAVPGERTWVYGAVDRLNACIATSTGRPVRDLPG